MARNKTPDPEIHALTVAEISRQTGAWWERQRLLQKELAEIQSATKLGVPPAQMSDHAKAVREQMVAMMNGSAPASLTLPPAILRDEKTLKIEIDAIDGIVKILQRQEIAAQAAEAAQWKLDHEEELRQIQHDKLLAWCRLEAIERREQALLADLRLHVYGLAMAQFIGGRMLEDIEIDWSRYPLARAIDAALAERIVTRREIEDAKNV